MTMEGRASESMSATGLAGSSLHRNRHPPANVIGHWALVIPWVLVLAHWALSTLHAHTLNSGILEIGSSARLVMRLAAFLPGQW